MTGVQRLKAYIGSRKLAIIFQNPLTNYEDG